MGMIKDPTSWRVGFELGLAGFSFPYSKPRKPTAYLYNGVRLPALPEWDREMYPYAVIGYCYTHGYVFSRSSNPWTANEYGKIFPARFSTYYASDDEWATTNGAVEYITPIWTNTDILNEDGSIYLSASEPIPVYE